MALSIFIAYLGGLLTCSVVLFVFVKGFSDQFAASGSKPTVYGVVSAIIASGASYLSIFISENLFLVFWILSGLYLVFGMVHVALTHRKYFRSRPDNKEKVFTGELFFAIALVMFTVLIFSALQYFVEDKNFLFFPMMMCVLSFFIPLLFVHTFDAAAAIPKPVLSSWEYPLNNPIDLPEDNPNERLLVIGFELSKKAADENRTYFRAKAPEAINLGELFYHFINDYHDLQGETPIEYTDERQEPWQWLFRTRPRWYQFTRVLNPRHSVRENRIRENTVIICERVPK